MPASQNRSNCAFRCGLRRLATKPTAKSGFKKKNGEWIPFQNIKGDIKVSGKGWEYLLQVVKRLRRT